MAARRAGEKPQTSVNSSVLTMSENFKLQLYLRHWRLLLNVLRYGKYIFLSQNINNYFIICLSSAECPYTSRREPAVTMETITNPNERVNYE